MRGALGAVGRSADRARSAGPSLGVAVVLLLAAATAGACTKTGSTPAPVDYSNALVMCWLQPLPAAPDYAGDVHPLVVPSWASMVMEPNEHITQAQTDTLAGQPVEQAQLVGCERTKWVDSPVGCSYGSGPDTGPTALMSLGRQMLTLWVATLATGRLVASTTMTGPEPTQNDCPQSITQGEAGPLPGPWVALSDRKAWFLGFVHGAVRDLAPVPSALAVNLVSMPQSMSMVAGGHVSVVTTPGAKCTLSMVQPVPGATPRANDDIWDRDLGPHPYAGIDGSVGWSWDLIGDIWDLGAATVTVTCTLGGATASTSGQTSLTH